MSEFLAADPHKSDANAVNTNKKGFCLSISGEQDNKVLENQFLWNPTYTSNKQKVKLSAHKKTSSKITFLYFQNHFSF